MGDETVELPEQSKVEEVVFNVTAKGDKELKNKVPRSNVEFLALNKCVGVWYPKDFLPELDRYVRLDQPDKNVPNRSLFFKKAVRAYIEQLKIKESAEFPE